MGARSNRRIGVAALSVLVIAVSLRAQGPLAPLGLTEARARRFVLDEIRSESAPTRRSPIAAAGHRAFYELPRPARGPAATALFAWARSYVGSPAFAAAYAEYRQGVIGTAAQAGEAPVDDQVKRQLDEMLAAIAEARKTAESLPPADRRGC
jgi:hypothetical protein